MPLPSDAAPVALPEQKARLRRHFLEARRTVQAPAAADAVAQAVVALIGRLQHGNRRAVAGYFAIGSELDPGPAMAALAAQGNTTLLPVAAVPGERLTFRAWRPGDPLEKGPYGTSHPTAAAPVGTPDVVLAPLLAFDQRGHRLGYGGGYYDRTLRHLRAERSVLAVGLGFDMQELPDVPAEVNDQMLDVIITERRTLIAHAHPFLSA
jgi:5-formyltetrahydrofolate cyclo-ligase